MANLPAGLTKAEDGVVRCNWCMATAHYQHYHDHEWGFPVHDERRLFEKICLEGFQSGLSWLTILRKRDNFRRAFANFEPTRVGSSLGRTQAIPRSAFGADTSGAAGTEGSRWCASAEIAGSVCGCGADCSGTTRSSRRS